MLELATMLILGIATLGFWFLGIEIKYMPLRVLFITIGFLLLGLAMAQIATFTSAYTVPAGTTSPYYNQAAVATLTALCNGLSYIFEILGITYLAIEIILYLKQVATMATNKKKNRLDEPYE